MKLGAVEVGSGVLALPFQVTSSDPAPLGLSFLMCMTGMMLPWEDRPC